MNFHPIEGPRLKVVTVDHNHPSKRTNKPRSVKPKKTQLPSGKGKRKVEQEISEDGRYLIIRPNIK